MPAFPVGCRCWLWRCMGSLPVPQALGMLSQGFLAVPWWEPVGRWEVAGLGRVVWGSTLAQWRQNPRSSHVHTLGLCRSSPCCPLMT